MLGPGTYSVTHRQNILLQAPNNPFLWNLIFIEKASADNY
jgi:hypothetical protein